MEMQPNREPKANSDDSPPNGHILYGGQKVDTIRYDIAFDPEKFIPTIQTANLALYQGRKQVAALDGLSREEVEKVAGPYNVIALENRVGANKRGNDPAHVKGSLARQALGYFESDPLSLNPQSSKDLALDVVSPDHPAAPQDPQNAPETEDRSVTEAKNQALYSELVALKNEHMGKDARLFRARDNTGRNQYDGPVIAETGSCIIQKISNDTAIVHEKTNLQRDVEVGDDVSIVYDKGKVYVEDLAADHDKPHDRRQHEGNPQEPHKSGVDSGHDPARANRASFFSARKMVLEQLGKDTKIYDAAKVDFEKGKFTGTVIAITDHHVMQRIGANTVISHEKADLAGLLSQGAFVQIQYQNGIGSISPMEKQFTREHDRALSR